MGWATAFWADGEQPNGENYLSTWGLEENRWNDADVADGYIVRLTWN